MGYQPKYAPQKKKGPSGAAVVLALLLVPLSLVCTGKLLSFLYHTPGEEIQAVTEPMKTPDMSISEQIGDFASIQLQNAEAALDGVLHETQPPETAKRRRVLIEGRPHVLFYQCRAFCRHPGALLSG